MLRELLTSKRRFENHGFALPTVMIVSVVMMMILVTAVQASASVRTALSNQYYNNLAAEAAEAGIMFAHACIQNKDGYASWNQLQPDTNCDGDGINGLPNGRYLIKKDGEMRTTFSVSGTSSVDADPYNLTVSGSVQLLRKSSPTNSWKTITVKKKMQVQPCSKTITNLISNPSFEMNSGGQFEPVSSGWSGYMANVYSTTNAGGLGDGFRTIMVQANNPNNNDSFAEATPALQAGKTYTVSGMLHRPANTWNSAGEWTGRRLSIAVYAYLPSSGTYFETYARSDSTATGNRRVSNTFTIPSGANPPFLRLYNGTTTGEVYWDSIMLTEGTTDYQYKDGDTPGWAWNGTSDNATSTGPVKAACTTASTCTPTNMITNPNIESGTTANFTSGATNFFYDSAWKASGIYSIGTVPTSSNGDSFVSIGGDDGGLRLGMQAGKTYTVSATVNVPYMEGSPLLPWRRAGIVIHTWNPISGWMVYAVNPTGKYQFRAGGEPTSQPNGWYAIADGSHKLSTTFTVPTNAVSAFVRLYNGGTNSTAPAPIVRWDNIALYEGTKAPYYDGKSPGWAWSGEPNLSTSSGPVVPCNAPISY